MSDSQRPAYPNFVKTIGASTAIAAAMEAFSGSVLPKGGTNSNPYTVEQGVIELGPYRYDMEKQFSMDLTGVATRREGLTIRGQTSGATKFYSDVNSSAANFKVGGFWSMFNILGNEAVSNLTLKDISLYCYFTQNGDGSSLLTDALKLVKILSVPKLILDNVTFYIRAANYEATDQYFLDLQNCYYGKGYDLKFVGFRGNTAGLSPGGGAVPRLFGTGVRIEVCNGFNLYSPEFNGVHRGVHFFNDDGSAIHGGNIEHFNQLAFFDRAAQNCKILDTRCEYHAVTDFAKDAIITSDKIYLAKFAETSSNNYVRINTPTSTIVNNVIDKSQYGGNVVDCPTSPKTRAVKNLAKNATWLNSASVTVAASLDVPPNSVFTASTQVTFPGNLNRFRYTSPIPIDPRMKCVTVSFWMKRISGDGFINPELRSNIGSGVYPFGGNALQEPQPGRWENSISGQGAGYIPLDTSGHSWDGTLVTLKAKVPHLLQPGLKVNATSVGSWTASAYELYVQEVVDDFTFTAKPYNSTTPYTVSPLPISGGYITLASDFQRWRGNKNLTPSNKVNDTTTGWQQFTTSLPVAGRCVSVTYDTSNHYPVLTFDGVGCLGLDGDIVRLWDFVDNRFNLDYTTQAGDIVVTGSGSSARTTLKLRPVGVDWTLSVPLDLTNDATGVASASNIGSDTISPYNVVTVVAAAPTFGWGGNTNMCFGFRTITNLNLPLVWNYTDPVIVPGNLKKEGLVYVPDSFNSGSSVSNAASSIVNSLLRNVDKVTTAPTAVTGLGLTANFPTSGSISVTGTDLDMQVTFTAGATTAADAVIGTITLANTYATTPRPILAPANKAAAALTAGVKPFIDGTNGNTLVITAGGTALTPSSGPFKFNVVGIG